MKADGTYTRTPSDASVLRLDNLDMDTHHVQTAIEKSKIDSALAEPLRDDVSNHRGPSFISDNSASVYSRKYSADFVAKAANELS